MKATVINTNKNIPIIVVADKAPVLPNSKVVAKALGISATIPEKIIKDIPFPIPLWVICSPNHIKKTVPATKVMTVVSLKKPPGSITIPDEFSARTPGFRSILVRPEPAFRRTSQTRSLSSISNIQPDYRWPTESYPCGTAFAKSARSNFSHISGRARHRQNTILV